MIGQTGQRLLLKNIKGGVVAPPLMFDTDITQRIYSFFYFQLCQEPFQILVLRLPVESPKNI